MSILLRGIRTIRHEGFVRATLLTFRYTSYRTGYHNLVSRLPRPFAEPLFRATELWVRLSIQLLHRFQPNKYTDAPPFKLIYVNPSTIKNVSGLHSKRRRGWVIDGDWDRDCERFLEFPIPRSIYEHYSHNVPWEETPLSELFDGEEFEEECKRITGLYKQIDQDGFKSQRQQIKKSPETSWRNINRTIAPYTDEITVDIGRDGEILWNMLGQHRLAIAKVLELPKVPVLVFARHLQWQKYRNHINTTIKNSNKDCRPNHPDLECLAE